MRRTVVSVGEQGAVDGSQDRCCVLDCGHAAPAASGPIGGPVDCLRCDRRELPAGYAPYRSTPHFTEKTVPRALLSRHSTKRGVWGRIEVIHGRLRYRILEPFAEEQVLAPGIGGIIAPEVEHEVSPLGPVVFFVEFCGPGGQQPS